MPPGGPSSGLVLTIGAHPRPEAFHQESLPSLLSSSTFRRSLWRARTRTPALTWASRRSACASALGRRSSTVPDGPRSTPRAAVARRPERHRGDPAGAQLCRGDCAAPPPPPRRRCRCRCREQAGIPRRPRRARQARSPGPLARNYGIVWSATPAGSPPASWPGSLHSTNRADRFRWGCNISTLDNRSRLSPARCFAGRSPAKSGLPSRPAFSHREAIGAQKPLCLKARATNLV
jgi:hypothetical protein